MSPWLRLLLLFGLSGAFLAAQAQTALTPKDQVVRSNYLEQKAPPQARAHHYDPRRPERIAEPYSPQLVIANYAFEEDLPKNRRLHWLTRISGGLASLFLGSQGVFEAAVRLYREEEYAEAAQRFARLYQRSGDLEQEAGLWLAWSLYQLGDYPESFKLARLLQSATTTDLAQEAYYLSALHLHRQGDLEGLKNLSQRALGQFKPQERGFRLAYALLVAQVKLERWELARKLLDQLQQEPLSHSPFYGKIKEIAGVIAYHEDDFKRALAEFKRAQRADPRGFAQSENSRYVAWLHYLSGQYAEALKQAKAELERPLPENRAELTYLSIAALTHLGQGEEIAALLTSLPEDSPFKAYAAFQVKVFLKDLDQRPELAALVRQADVRFKNLRFYAALLDGNAYFAQGEFKAARAEYQKAKAQESEQHYGWIARYNLGLIDLKEQRWAQARKTFAALQSEPEPINKKWTSYHLLFALYQLGEAEAFAERFGAADFSTLDQDIQWEVFLLKGSLHYAQGETDAAVAAYLWGWRQGRRAEALEYAAQALYAKNRFDAVIDLAQEHREVDSDLLLSYEIRSLLGLRRFEAAKTRLQARGYTGERLLALHVEVWLNTGDYERIVARVRPLLENPGLSAAQRRVYYLTLGDAYFNLNQLAAARLEYHKALELTEEPAERSNLLYSLALTRYAEPGRPAFAAEAGRILAEEPLVDSVRLNLTLLLSAQLQAQGQPETARQLLGEQAARLSQPSAKLQVRRAALARSQGDLKACAELAGERPEGTSAYEQVDLMLLEASCQLEQNQPQAALAALEPQAGDYRRNEQTYFKAEALSRLGQAEASQTALSALPPDLPVDLKARVRLSKTRNLIALERPEEAAQALGDWRDYRARGLEEEALALNAQLQGQQGDRETAARSLLRLHYDKSLPQKRKIEVDLKLADLYRQMDRPEKARQFLADLPEELSPEQAAQKAALQKQLNPTP